MSADAGVALDRDRHVKYWKRCAQLLPEQYTAGESNRMSFGFFIVAALDLLDALETATTPEERQSWIEWIYACQVPFTGGFRGFTGTNLGGMRTPHNWHWDSASLPNTYFALATLLMLGDDMNRVKRKECIEWVRSLQRQNGSFGETLGEDDVIEGGDDPRLCMCALGTLCILQGRGLDGGSESLIDATKLKEYILNCQSHDGGIAQQPLLEAHSGLNYCGIATLSFLGLLQNPPVPAYEVAGQTGLDTEACIKWMLDRQTTWVEEEDEDEDEDEDEEDDVAHNSAEQQISSSVEADPSRLQKTIAGFCGRCGKMADTCYCFWNAGALAILQRQHLVDIEALRYYLLGKVAHLIGGFAKAPGELPDLLHSYTGLAALAIYGEPGLKALDPTFCFSRKSVEKLKDVAWRSS
ncbi:uncharacterized protein PV06_06190 [Exophiala oligosperma]|uniref:Prenyltransferase alpha-alpha toroid domain-containing protein n=1 Tax=Exophiala oligosperma TaxID=215243 RepID=A0A0D2DI27_9EURO|nr:uncharacterized protein PV06_06190 [Exophiala oligosperma]KIW42663.1 hypothetical protein PV06_06190 [Exophiala oligosperma]